MKKTKVKSKNEKQNGQKFLLSILFVIIALFASYLVHFSSRKLPLDNAYKPLARTKKLPVIKPYTFPGGGRVLLPTYRFVALYGAPSDPALGALGEQPMAPTIERVKKLAAEHQAAAPEHILPTLEIIATIANTGPTPNNDYSREVDPAMLMPWVEAARQAGVYVVLDLQPGRSDFLSQAKIYENLLDEPNVGLALDPEWRLKPNQVHLTQIGSVDINEVNAVAQWLAALTKKQKLPQKLFLLHQFQLTMISNRQLLDSVHPELAYVIQMDGQGAQAAKLDTWHAILQAPPPNTEFGWKNFYKKDNPVLSPVATMQLVPTPRYVSYQ